MSAIVPTFAGEIQLAGWSESHTGGCKVTFWLQSTDDLAAFRALTTRKGNIAGHRFMAALVEIGEDEMPVQPEPVADIRNRISEKEKIGPLAYWLVCRCSEPEFWRWLEYMGYKCASAKAAELFQKSILNVKSRNECDTDTDAGNRFHRLIRGPYSRWLAARGVTR